MAEIDRSFGANLDRWVSVQRRVLESMKKVEEELEKGDRLDLVLATRAAFQHMTRTIQAFDKWLQDPFIVGHMPREMLEEVRKRVWRIMEEMLELDIKHTSEFKEYISKLAREGRLNPLLYTEGSGREERRFISV